MAKKTAKKKTKKKTMSAAKKKAPVKKLTKKVAKPSAKRAAKVAKTKLPGLTVVRIAARPAVRVARIEVRLPAKNPVAPASFRAAPTVGRLLPPPAREE